MDHLSWFPFNSLLYSLIFVLFQFEMRFWPKPILFRTRNSQCHYYYFFSDCAHTTVSNSTERVQFSIRFNPSSHREVCAWKRSQNGHRFLDSCTENIASEIAGKLKKMRVFLHFCCCCCCSPIKCNVNICNWDACTIKPNNRDSTHFLRMKMGERKKKKQQKQTMPTHKYFRL